MSNGKNTILRLGICGAGNRGVTAFGEMIRKMSDARIVALSDPNPVRAQNAAKIIGGAITCYPSIEEMLDSEALDGVIITSPDYTHEENTVAAVKRGVNALVDKPLATTAGGCMRIIRAARENNLEVSVGFNLRYVPVLRKMKEIIDSGEIGRIMMIENSEFYNGGRSYMSRWNRMYKLSGGLWIHKGSHDIDILNWLNSGGNPVRVSSFSGLNALRPDGIPFHVEEGVPVGPYCAACKYAGKCPDYIPEFFVPDLFTEDTAKADGYYRDQCIFTSEKDTHDNGITMVEYDNNVRVSLSECFVCNYDDRTYKVIGDKGIIFVSLSSPTRIEIRPRWSAEDKIIHVPSAGEWGHGGGDIRMVNDFLESIRTGNGNCSTSMDGLRSVAVGEAAEKSWREHRTVEISELVDLKEYPVI